MFVFLQTSIAFSAAALQRQVQQKQIEEQIIQQQYQQAIAQKQAQEMMRYQQAIAQKQAYEKQVYQQAYQQAAYQKAVEEYQSYKYQMQQIVAQKQAQMQLAQQVKTAIAQKQALEAAQYQQVVAFKQQSMINAQVNEYASYLSKRQQVALQEAAIAKQMQTAKDVVELKKQEEAIKKQAIMIEQAKIVQAGADQYLANEVVGQYRETMQPIKEQALGETIVDIGDLWRALEKNSFIWNQIIDREIKVLTIAEYMDRFLKMGIKIKKSPGFYVQMIDEMVLQNTEILNVPFANVLTYVAIMEYDFDNGENKDELAKRTLGEERFMINRKRVFGK